MKGLVLSGGLGTRLRPLTYSQQKQLIPIANKPILFYSMEDIIEAGIKDIGIIVGPNKEQVIETVRSASWEANIEFIYQGEPKGLAHAVKVAGDFIGDSSFVMYLGDNLLKEGIEAHVDRFINGNFDCSILLSQVKDPQRFGVAELNSRGEVVRLIEKPAKPPSNLALVGIYIFKPIVFQAVENIKPSWRGELEITDAIQWLIDRGYKVVASLVSGWWKDTGLPEDILEGNRLVLDGLEPENLGLVGEDASIEGRVRIGEGTRIIGKSVIKGPAVIGANCVIENSCIGPYTTIGNRCRIISSEIQDSIVMEATTVEECGRIVDSLIGRDAKVRKRARLPDGCKFVIGDSSEVEV